MLFSRNLILKFKLLCSLAERLNIKLQFFIIIIFLNSKFPPGLLHTSQPIIYQDCKRKHRSRAGRQAREKFHRKLDEVRVTFLDSKEPLSTQKGKTFRKKTSRHTYSLVTLSKSSIYWKRNIPVCVVSLVRRTEVTKKTNYWGIQFHISHCWIGFISKI